MKQVHLLIMDFGQDGITIVSAHMDIGLAKKAMAEAIAQNPFFADEYRIDTLDVVN